MHRFLLAAAAILLGIPSAQAAQQIDFSVAFGNVNGNLKAIALLNLPNGNLVAVYQYPTVAGVCPDPACVFLERLGPNGQSLPNASRVKAAGFLTVNAAAMDSLGRIVVIGDVQGAGSDGTDFGVVRFLADNSDDLSFAGDGGTQVNFGLGQSNNDAAKALAIDRDNNVVVVGSVQRAGTDDTDFGVIRLRGIDGGLDPTFIGSGKRTVYFDLNSTSPLDIAKAVAIGNDGTIVIGGDAYDAAISIYRPVLARLTASGNLDTTFCNPGCTPDAGYPSTNTGKRVYYFGPLTAHTDSIFSLDVASNGDIALAGLNVNYPNFLAAVARLSASGNFIAEALEPGTGGYAIFESVKFADGQGSRILAAGASGSFANYFFVQAFTGSLATDSSYGNCLTTNSALCFEGTLSTTTSDYNDIASLLTLDQTGRPLFAGTYTENTSSLSGVLFQRISNTNGPRPDRIFRHGFQ